MKIFTRKPVNSRLFAAALLLMLSGCVVGPKYHPPSPPAPAAVYKESPAQFKETEGWTVAQPADAKLRGKWWEIFNDPELNALEDQLNINNQNIKQYFENFMEARAVVREARSQYFPTLSVVPSVTHSRTSANVGSANANSAGTGTTSSPTTAKYASIPCRSKRPGNLIFGARSATRCAKPSTLPRSARPTSRTSV